MNTDSAPRQGGTQIAFETGEAPAALARLLDNNMSAYLDLAKRLGVLQPPVIATCARGQDPDAPRHLKKVTKTL